tara:strand:- start:1044 stop:1775 length:732 start_codon:yes stop_codon:yes gene_type:complete
VHKLSSPKTHLPYDYYSLPFCEPPGGKIRVAENLGEVLHGSIIQNSPYEVLMGKSEFKVCCLSKLTRAQKTNLVAKVKKDYRIHMIMDNLPAATKMIAEMPDGTKKDMYDRGFRLGFIGSKDIPGTDPGVAYVNNHLRFIVKYHKSDTFTGARIVGFEVEAYSVKHTYAGCDCPNEWLRAMPKALLRLQHHRCGRPCKAGACLRGLLSDPPSVHTGGRLERQGAEAHVGAAAARPSADARNLQ